VTLCGWLAWSAGCSALGRLGSAMAAAAAQPDSLSHGTVRGDAFESSALGARKHLMVYLPPSYGRDTTRRYPVAYYLHGLSGSETDWLARGAIDATADSVF